MFPELFFLNDMVTFLFITVFTRLLTDLIVDWPSISRQSLVHSGFLPGGAGCFWKFFVSTPCRTLLSRPGGGGGGGYGWTFKQLFVHLQHLHSFSKCFAKIFLNNQLFHPSRSPSHKCYMRWPIYKRQQLLSQDPTTNGSFVLWHHAQNHTWQAMSH